MIEKHCLTCNVILVKTRTTSVAYFVNHKNYCSIPCSNKNRIVSEATKKKHSEDALRLGLRPPSFLELTLEKQKLVRKKLAQYPSPFLGRTHTAEAKRKNSDAHRGSKSPTWKGGITFAKNYKRFNKMKYLNRKYNSPCRHSKVEWEELKLKYNFMCLCCKQQEPFVKLTEDHIIPLSTGGTDGIENIQPLCQSCNSRKWTSVTDFRASAGVRQ